MCRNRQVRCGIGLLAVIAFAPAVGSAQPVLHVDDSATGANDGSSWCDAYRYLQDALTAARASAGAVTEIRVAQGVYKPDRGANQTPGNRAASFELVNGVALRGGYAGCGVPDPDERDPVAYGTILSGDLNGDDPPDVSDCCRPTAPNLAGCGDSACKSAVCAVEPDCCGTNWSQICVDLADGLCAALCSTRENACHVVLADSTSVGTALDGFTIEAGNANCPYPDDSGGGLYNRGSLGVVDCTFRNNFAIYGGGVNNWKIGSTSTFTDCNFYHNVGSWYGGGMLNSQGARTLLRCVFHENTAGVGGGLDNADGSQRVIDCVFSRNAAGRAAGMSNYGLQVIIGCAFIQNDAWGLGGGMTNEFASPFVSNCMFHGNSAESGGAMFNMAGSPIVVNSSFVDNMAAYSGGAVYNSSALDSSSNPIIADCTFTANNATSGSDIANWESFPVLSNSIMWHSTMPSIRDFGGSLTSISYSDIEGGFPGLGNVDVDPVFIGDPGPGPDGFWGTDDDDYGDLPLSRSSPCIDAGNNSAVPPDTLDLDNDGNTTEPTPFDLHGNRRFNDDPRTPDTGAGMSPIVDMGAYEYQPPCESDTNCDNGRFCDGAELCTAGICGPGSAPCAGLRCDEVMNACVDCLDDADCDDGDPCNGTESCDATGSCVRRLSADCNSNAIEDFCDINGGGSFDANGNGVPDECDPGACCGADGSCQLMLAVDCSSGLWLESTTCTPNRCPIRPIVAALGGRYLSVTPQAWVPTEMVAIRISSPRFPCLSKYVARDSGIGRVIDNPVFLPASQWGTVYVADTEIVPATMYQVQTENSLGLSHTATATTPLWGDVADRIGIVDALDIVGFVDRFKSRPGSPPTEACDLYPAVPDQVVDALDITMAVDAFKGFSYPFPLPCP